MIVRPSDRLDGIKSYYFARKLAEISRLNQVGPQVINLGVGNPDLAPPKSVIDRLTNESNKDHVHGYQPYTGLPELRNAWADWYANFYGVTLDSEKEVLPLMGSKEGIMHISMSFLSPGDQVLIPDPGYPAYRSAALAAGGEPKTYDLSEQNNWLPDLENLQKEDLTKVKLMWVNYPHMPTGAKASPSDFEKLVDFGIQNNILICHDNPYSFILNKEPISILAAENAFLCCIELNSLSKSYHMAGWRIGLLAGGEEYIKTVLRFKSNMDSGMFKPLQLSACEALSLNADWHDKINEIYGKRRLKIYEICDQLECIPNPDSAGLFVWAKIPDRIKEVEEWTDQILYSSRVFITPGHIFGKNGSRYIRISLCSKMEVYDQARDRISQSFKKKVKQQYA